MRNRFWRAVPVAVVSVLALCFMAGCEECPDFEEEQPTGECALTGYVLDAISGDGISGAEVYIVGDGSTETDESGWFFIAEAPCGDDDPVEITADGYIDLEVEIEVDQRHDGARLRARARCLRTMGTASSSRGVRIRPTSTRTCGCRSASAYYHVYYANDGYLDQEPYAQLDMDDVTSYGPETITVRKHELTPAALDGLLRGRVHLRREALLRRPVHPRVRRRGPHLQRQHARPDDQRPGRHARPTTGTGTSAGSTAGRARGRS